MIPASRWRRIPACSRASSSACASPTRATRAASTRRPARRPGQRRARAQGRPAPRHPHRGARSDRAARRGRRLRRYARCVDLRGAGRVGLAAKEIELRLAGNRAGRRRLDRYGLALDQLIALRFHAKLRQAALVQESAGRRDRRRRRKARSSGRAPRSPAACGADTNSCDTRLPRRGHAAGLLVAAHLLAAASGLTHCMGVQRGKTGGGEKKCGGETHFEF